MEVRQLTLDEAPAETPAETAHRARTWYGRAPSTPVIHIRSAADHTRTLCREKITWGLYVVNGPCLSVNCGTCRRRYEALDDEIASLEERHAQTLATPAAAK